MTSEQSALADRLELPYRILSGDDSDERACAAIPDEACAEVPRNYLFNVTNGAATKLAEQLASPGLVLPWLASAVGAPAAIAALFVPVKQAGSLAPQLAVAGAIRSLSRRKWAWVLAGATQALALALIGVAALTLDGLTAGATILALFVVFSVMSGVGSVAFQDVVGKTVPKGHRGRMLSNRATIGGVLTLAAAAGLHLGVADRADTSLTLALVFAAALLWVFGALAFAAIDEAPGAGGGGRSMLTEVRRGIRLFREVAGFRKFIAARSLLLGVELAMPFFALHAAALFGVADLMVYVLAVGLANILSSPFWGSLSDADAKSVMTLSGAIGAAAGLAALGFGLLPEGWQGPWLFAGAFFLLGVAEAGVRLGRKTYLVDGAPKDERPLYVAFSNTAVGVLALAGGVLGLLADLTAPQVSIALLVLLSGLGAVFSSRLSGAEDMVEG